jgi:lipopolysaccharide exporter
MKDRPSFWSNVRTLASGTLIAQVVAAASAPVLARLFGPAEFGAFATYSAVAIVIAGFACLQYDLAIMLPKEHARAAPVFVLAIGLTATVALGSGIGVLAVRQFHWSSHFGRLEAWLPASVLAAGLVSAASYWASRMRSFRELAVSKVALQVVSAAMGIGAALVGAGTAAALVVASVVGQFSALFYLGRTVLKRSGLELRAGWSWPAVRAAAFEHRKFPQYSVWANLLNNASWQVPVLVLGFSFSAAAVGFYAVALRIIQIPMGLISTSVGQVYLQHLTENADPQRRIEVTEAVFARLVSISIVPCACLAISGRELFVVLLGPPWAEAGALAQILAPWALVWFVSSPLSSVYYSLQKQKEELLLQGLLFASRTLAVWAGGYWGSLRMAVSCLAVAGILSYGVLIRSIFGYVGGDVRRALGQIGAGVWWSLVALLGLMASKVGGLPPPVTATLAVLICAGATFRLLRSKHGIASIATGPA